MSSEIFSAGVICLAGTAFVGFFLSLAVFYGFFSFGNIEQWDCYASMDKDVLVPWDPN